MLASLTGHSSSINWNVRQIYNHLLFLSRTGCLWFQWQPWRRVTMSTSNSGGHNNGWVLGLPRFTSGASLFKCYWKTQYEIV